MRVPAFLPSAVLMAAAVSAVASATPPVSGSGAPAPAVATDGTPLVGRVRFADRTVDLTRSSLSASGAARELREATALPVQADIEPNLTRRGAERRASPDISRDRFAR